MINKKGASSLMGSIMGIVLIIGIFSGFILFYNDQLTQNNEILDSKYNTTYAQLLEVQDNLDARADNIKTAVDETKEAETGFIAAINGFKGIGEAMLLLLGFTSDSIDVTEALLLSTDIIPSWAQSLIFLSLVLLIVFIVMDVLLGRKAISA